MRSYLLAPLGSVPRHPSADRPGMTPCQGGGVRRPQSLALPDLGPGSRVCADKAPPPVPPRLTGDPGDSCSWLPPLATPCSEPQPQWPPFMGWTMPPCCPEGQAARLPPVTDRHSTSCRGFGPHPTASPLCKAGLVPELPPHPTVVLSQGEQSWGAEGWGLPACQSPALCLSSPSV